MPRSIVTILIVVSFIFIYIPETQAKHRERLDFSYEQLWSATVRFIRVDMNWKIEDKDKDTGYIIFKYTGKNIKDSRAAVEIITEKSGEKEKQTINYFVQVTISEASSVEERMLIRDLRKKLSAEY